jgi:TolA-binding protein
MGRVYRTLCPGLLLISLTLVACGESPVTRRYRIERDMLRASRMDRQLQIRSDAPPTPESAREILKTYERVLSRNPLPTRTAPADTVIIHEIGRIRAGAELRVVDLQRFLGDTTAVRQRLEEGARAYSWDNALSLTYRRALIEESLARGDGGKAVRLYQAMAADLPARGPTGRPVIEVLQAPIRAADLLNQMGFQDEAFAELDRAEVYYRDLIGDSPHDVTAAWSWLQIAEASRRRNNLNKAADALLQARRAAAGDSLLEPSILLSLGVLLQEGKRDMPAAIASYAELRRSFPARRELAAEAMWREAACQGELKRYDLALAMIDTLESRFPRDRVNIARGRLIGARVLTQEGRWQEAQSRYRSLQADYPDSPEALSAPFEVAAHYAEQGEMEAVRTTLQRAIDDYRRLVEDPTASDQTRRRAAEIAVSALVKLERWADAAAQIVSNVKRFPRDPRNPQELIQAAAIYKERLSDPARAADLLEQMATDYPGSPLAGKAREEAGRLRGQ